MPDPETQETVLMGIALGLIGLMVLVAIAAWDEKIFTNHLAHFWADLWR